MPLLPVPSRLSVRPARAALAALAAVLLLAARPAAGAELSYRAISMNWPQIIALDYHEPSNEIVASVYYPNGAPYSFARVRRDAAISQWSTVSNISSEVMIATARSPEAGGWPGSPFPAGTMFAGNGVDGQILKIDPSGAVTNPWATMPGAAGTRGLFRGSLMVDPTGLFGGDLIAVASNGKAYRVNGSGTGTLIGNSNSFLQGLTIVPNDPATWGALAGKIVAGDETASRLYAFDGAGGVAHWTVGVRVNDLDVVPPDQNFFVNNAGSGRVLGVDAAQFAAQGLVGKLIATQEASPSGLFELAWSAAQNAPVFTPITVAPGSPATPSGHLEQVTFAPAGIAEIRTTLPVAGYSLSAAFGTAHGQRAVPIPTSTISRYAYNGSTGNPPEARPDTAVFTVVEEPTGHHHLLAVFDRATSPTGGALSLSLAGTGSDLAGTTAAVRDDVADPWSYSAGSGSMTWSWPAGQTDGMALRLPFPRPAQQPGSGWSITITPSAVSGVSAFVFLFNGQSFDLGDGSTPFTLGVPETVLTVGVPREPAPAALALTAPHPNPTRDRVRFEFELERSGRAEVSLYDLAGRKVRTLRSGILPAGRNHGEWDGRDAHGRPLPNGVYFLHATHATGQAVRRIVLAR